MLETSIKHLNGIGPRQTAIYKQIGIETVRDLLLEFPYRYDDFRNTTQITDVKPGENATINGTLTSIRSRRSPRKKMNLTEATIEDTSGTIQAIWFHQPYLAKTLKIGDNITLSGKIDAKYGLSLLNPQYEVIKKNRQTIQAGKLAPVYSIKKGIAQKGRRTAIRHAITYIDKLKDWIPEEYRDEYQLCTLGEAIKQIHFPENQEQWNKAIRRMKFGELLVHQLSHIAARQTLEKAKATKVEMQIDKIKELTESLPFTLTDAQRKAAFAILQDTATGSPMHRLLEGDVGSGKTVVAAIAAYNMSLSAHQTAYLAPTELLATQQYESLRGFLPENITVAILTSSYKSINGQETTKKELKDALIDGRIDVIVGTHALIFNIEIPALEFVIIDEQHRFGVEQRKVLLSTKKTGTVPHFLSMTATPIPRTLALALYGDMAISILDELPKNRGNIETILLKPGKDNAAYNLMADKLKAGKQAFVVCPFIESSEISEADSVEELTEKLQKTHLKNFKIQALHGKMKPKDKEKIMQDFATRKISVLVATTVIEVGINIPNATMIFIEGAERFGLAQLHQLRGRVRRSTEDALCILHPSSMSGATKQRMQAMVDYDNGFKLAEIDLQLRGSGDRFGTRQSGELEFEFASLSDHSLIAQAKEAAEAIINKDPELKMYTSIAKHLKEKLGKEFYA